MLSRFSRTFGAAFLLLFGVGAVAQVLPLLEATPQQFSQTEREAIVQSWNAPGRYKVEPRPDPKGQGPFVVRLTPDASRWFAAYNRFVKTSALAATTVPLAPNQLTPAQQWEKWVTAKVDFDRALAAQRSAENNALWLKTGGVAAPLNLASPAPSVVAVPPVLPLLPGPIPSALQAGVGDPPAFAASVWPMRSTIRFESGETVVLVDNVAVGSPRYPSYRFAQGVIYGGAPLSRLEPTELDRLFASATLTPTESRVVRAVSKLEGGFDAVNTYDTGFVSVGFIQFAALENGVGSLATLLGSEKANNPLDFERDFRAYGLDVSPAGALVALDPATGAELVGREAVQKIIEDKRLTAVFQLAGTRSDAFRAAQIRVARAMYYPAALPVQVKLGDQILSGQVGDIMHCEAGLATLLDRKVNNGNLRPLNEVLGRVMQKHGLTQLAELSAYEREIILAMKWRRDFLQDSTLTQPQ